jgi:hypothetical protein
MGADFNIKPVGAPVSAPLIDTASVAAKMAVPTQLPPDKAVMAPDSAQLARNNTDAENQRVSRQVVIDRAAAAIVYQTVDSSTNMVISQFPDEGRLRARAYLRAQDQAKLDHANQNTDVKA